MKSASVSRLKASLSAYLEMVKTGEAIVVTDRGRAGPMAAMAILSLAGAALLVPVVVAGGDSFLLPSRSSLLHRAA